jgi:hypothetical protein
MKSLVFALVFSAALAAQPKEVAYIAHGAGWTTSIIAVAGAEPAQFRVDYNIRGSIGETQPFKAITGATYAQLLSIGPNGTVQIDSANGPWLEIGYGELTALAGKPTFTVLYRYEGNEAATLAPRPLTAAVTSYSTDGFVTGIALVNPDEVEAPVRMQFFNEAGALLHTSDLGLRAKHHMIFNLGNFLPQVANTKGTMRITSSVGVAAVNLRVGPQKQIVAYPVR